MQLANKKLLNENVFQDTMKHAACNSDQKIYYLTFIIPIAPSSLGWRKQILTKIHTASVYDMRLSAQKTCCRVTTCFDVWL
jgi:hypothetical protein